MMNLIIITKGKRIMRNIQKYIEEYRTRFFDDKKPYTTIRTGELQALVESGKDKNTVDPYLLAENAVFFGFMVGYKAAIHEMKQNDQDYNNRK